jgi:hypothetical protein
MPRITEEELMTQLSEAERDYAEGKRLLSAAKKMWTEAETKMINSKLHMERVQEAIRVYHNTTYKKDHGAREKEIKAFQEKFPDLCAMAKQRDKDRP